MDKFDIYETIATRTNGDIYLGVVGPVRTGKSTFITKFVSELIIPYEEDPNEKIRTIDELPQSGNGKTIMTMQPRFVPNEAAKIKLANGVSANVRLVDCVGYLIDGVNGVTENGKSRFVKTPWNENEIPFEEAAEIGTYKVIHDHSTIGVVVTTDGSFGELSRVNYVPAEERVVRELKEINKPFVVVLNTTKPEDIVTLDLVSNMKEKYGVPVLPINVNEMKETEILNIIEAVLYEFPIKKINVSAPKWLSALQFDSSVISSIISEFMNVKACKMSDYKKFENLFLDSSYIEPCKISDIKLSLGEIDLKIDATRELFFKTISEMCGEDIFDDLAMMNYVKNLAVAKREYEKLKDALNSVNENGYGIVVPNRNEMTLGEPVIVKKGQNSGVKLTAKAPCLHIMKIDVETEVMPAVSGSEMNTELANNLLAKYEENPSDIWETNMFGKSLTDLAHDGIMNKIMTYPEEAKVKMEKTVQKITNEGKGGILCILL